MTLRIIQNMNPLLRAKQMIETSALLKYNIIKNYLLKILFFLDNFKKQDQQIVIL